MKHIKFFVTVLLLSTAFFAKAQIKVYNDGHVSLGSLNTTYGVQVYNTGRTEFSLQNDFNANITMTIVENSSCKSWVVKRTNTMPMFRFYVEGNGDVYRNESYSISNPGGQNNVGPIVNPTNTLEQINGFYYTIPDEPKDDRKDNRVYVGFSAQELEKVLPEAVVTTKDGNMYINYEVLTVFLVEAVKEQQNKIQELYSVLEENGLIKK